MTGSYLTYQPTHMGSDRCVFDQEQISTKSGMLERHPDDLLGLFCVERSHGGEKSGTLDGFVKLARWRIC